MSWGYAKRVHAYKVRPWTVRLKAANNELAAAYQSKDPERIHAALADVWFWVGRIMGDVIPSAAQLDRRTLKAVYSQVLRANRLLEK